MTKIDNEITDPLLELNLKVAAIAGTFKNGAQTQKIQRLGKFFKALIKSIPN